jgi:hypothetical protein
MTHSVGPIFTETSVIVTVSVLGAVGIAWAIVVGIITVSKIIVRHRERMAQIGMTINGQQPGTSSQSGTDSAYRSEWPQKSAAG